MTTKTQTALRKLIADASTAPTIRRAATLRLGRLRAASRPAITTRATSAKPATPPVPTEKARYEALQSFLALSRHRSALHRKRCTPAEYELKAVMTCLMPATAPTTDDPGQWRDFISRISGILEEIKSSIKPI
jgi:hypothetical protein